MNSVGVTVSPNLPMTSAARPFGELLRQWRSRRRLSQMALALDADVSPRHLSFVESGRSQPSRDMVLRLADQLALPLREQNQLLLSAGYAPIFKERSLEHPDLVMVHKAMELILTGHEPFPALAVDRHWNMLAANRAVGHLMVGLPEFLLKPAVNVLRVSLHPQGLAPRIVNLSQWRAHIFPRLQHQINLTGDPVLTDLLRELRAYPGRDGLEAGVESEINNPVVPILLRSGDQVLSFLTTTMVFGTPIDVTLSELAIETFFPADAQTSQFLHDMAKAA